MLTLYRALVLTLLATLALPTSAQTRSEDAFAAATRWTVFVRASVETPFDDEEQGSWTGAGFLVDRGRGWILTNAHVASRSPASLTVAFKDQRPVPVERVYVDPYHDVAVLRIAPAQLPPGVAAPTLACDRLPPTGHPVGAFGHPWGFRYTGTRGITSATTARFGPDMLQTDAAINAGNSGGPLISLDTGAVVGINALMVERRNQKGEGLGFAVPMPAACRILALLRESRDPSPPETLVHFAVEEGDEPTLVVADSRLPSGALAFAVGDRVTAVDGAAVATVGAFTDALRGRLDDVRVTVERDGQPLTLRGSWPAQLLLLDREGVKVAGALFAATPLGLSAFLQMPTPLMVHHVDPGSAAEAAEIRPTDLLHSIDGQPVATLAELRAAVSRAVAEDRPVRLLFMRVGSREQLFSYQRRELEVDGAVLVSTRTDGAHAAATTAAR